MKNTSDDLRSVLFSPTWLAAIYVLVLVALSVLLFGGCSSTAQLGSVPADPDQFAFGRTNLLSAPLALERALRVYDSAYGLEKSRFRIDMRRHYWGWRIEFIRIPESPDLMSVVKVYDDGRAVQGAY